MAWLRTLPNFLMFGLFICIFSLPTEAFWTYNHEPTGLETDVGVEDQTYTDGLSNKNAPYETPNPNSINDANNWAVPEQNSVPDDSYVISSESKGGKQKRKRNDDNDDITADIEFNGVQGGNDETHDENAIDDNELARRRRSWIYNYDDTNEDLRKTTVGSNDEDGVHKSSIVRRNANQRESGESDNVNNGEINDLRSKRSAANQTDNKGNKTHNATRGSRELDLLLPVNIASPPSDSEIERDLDDANKLINKIKYSTDDDNDDEESNDDFEEQEDDSDDDSVSGEAKRDVDGNINQQMNRFHEDSINKRAGNGDDASLQELLDDLNLSGIDNDEQIEDDDIDPADSEQKRDLSSDDSDNDDNDNATDEDGLEDDNDNDDNDDSDDDISRKRETVEGKEFEGSNNMIPRRKRSIKQEIEGLAIDITSRKIRGGENNDGDEADDDDNDGGLAIRRKKDTIIDEGADDDDDADDDGEDDNDDDEDDNDDDDDDVEGSVIRRKRDTNVDEGPDDDDDDDNDDNDDEIDEADNDDDDDGGSVITRKRDTNVDEGSDDDDDDDNDDDIDEDDDNDDDGGSAIRRKKDTSINDVRADDDDDDNDDDDDGGGLVIRHKRDTSVNDGLHDDDDDDDDDDTELNSRRKRDTGIPGSLGVNDDFADNNDEDKDTVKRHNDQKDDDAKNDVGHDWAYVRKKRSADPHRSFIDETDKANREKDNRVPDSDVKSRKTRTVFAYTETDRSPDEGYGSWSEWSGCSTACGLGRQFRKRFCHDNTHCRNGDLEEKICEGINCA